MKASVLLLGVKSEVAELRIASAMLCEEFLGFVRDFYLLLWSHYYTKRSSDCRLHIHLPGSGLVFPIHLILQDLSHCFRLLTDFLVASFNIRLEKL